MKNKTAKKQKPVVLNGLLYFSGDDGSEDYESLCLLPRPYTHSAGVLVNLLMTLSGKKASVRYYISDNPIESEDAVSEAYFSTLTGHRNQNSGRPKPNDSTIVGTGLTRWMPRRTYSATRSFSISATNSRYFPA